MLEEFELNGCKALKIFGKQRRAFSFKKYKNHIPNMCSGTQNAALKSLKYFVIDIAENYTKLIENVVNSKFVYCIKSIGMRGEGKDGKLI